MATRQASELAQASLAGDETIATPYGTVQLEHSYPTDASSALLFDVMDAQRAAQAYLWSFPLVGFAFWRDAQARVFDAGQFGDFVVFDSLREKRGIVTANLTTPYVINWTNLTAGPVLIDYPPGATAGGVLDFWQRPVADLGLTGPDQGQGGAYIVIAPLDDPRTYEHSGRIVIQSATNSELNAVVEAEVAVERAAAIRGAALLDTLTTLAAAEEVQREAMVEAAATVVAVEAFRSTIAAEAVRALVVAGLLTEADAPEAIDILVDAELITSESVADAATIADAAIVELSQDW